MLWNFVLDGRTMIVPDEPEKRALIGTWGSNHLRRVPRQRVVCRWRVHRRDGGRLYDGQHSARYRQFAQKADGRAFIERLVSRVCVLYRPATRREYVLEPFVPKPKHTAGWRRKGPRL